MKRNNKRLYESIIRDVSKIVKRHLNEGNNSNLRLAIINYLRFNKNPLAIHYNDNVERDNILNLIDNITEKVKLYNDINVIDMSDYTNVNDYISLIQDYVDSDNVLLVFDLNTKIPANIFSSLMTIMFDNKFGDDQILFKSICLIDNSNFGNNSSIMVSHLSHYDL